MDSERERQVPRGVRAPIMRRSGLAEHAGIAVGAADGHDDRRALRHCRAVEVHVLGRGPQGHLDRAVVAEQFLDGRGDQGRIPRSRSQCPGSPSRATVPFPIRLTVVSKLAMRSSAGADQLGGAEPVAVAPIATRAEQHPESRSRPALGDQVPQVGGQGQLRCARLVLGGQRSPGGSRVAATVWPQAGSGLLRSRTPSRWQITAMGSGKASASMRSNPAAASAEAKEPAGDLADRRLQAGYRLRGDATADEDRPLPAVRRYPPRPLVRSALGAWMTADHAAAESILRDRRFSSSPVHQRGYRPPPTRPGIPARSFRRRPAHDGPARPHPHRRLVSGAFTPKAIAGLEPWIREVTGGLSPLPTPQQASTSSTRWPSRCPSR